MIPSSMIPRYLFAAPSDGPLETMCGIRGFIGPSVPGLLEQTAEATRHRGPDSGGSVVLAGLPRPVAGAFDLLATGFDHLAAPRGENHHGRSSSWPRREAADTDAPDLVPPRSTSGDTGSHR